MYDFRPNLIIGFHGCKEEAVNKLLNRKLPESRPVILNYNNEIPVQLI